jgi:hypothetical protein
MRQAAMAILVSMFGCSSQPKTESVTLQVTVSDLSNTPVEGATVTLDKRRAGKTDADGMLKTIVPGKEGKKITAAVSCPEGYRNGKEATADVTVRVSRPLAKGDGAPLPIFAKLVCVSVTQKFVLVVRTNQSRKIPVSVGGNVIVYTDLDGVAQTVQSGPIGEEIEVVLNTDECPELSPRSPVRRLVIPDTPQILIFEQDFVVPKKKKKKRPAVLGPRRI